MLLAQSHDNVVIGTLCAFETGSVSSFVSDCTLACVLAVSGRSISLFCWMPLGPNGGGLKTLTESTAVVSKPSSVESNAQKAPLSLTSSMRSAKRRGMMDTAACSKFSDAGPRGLPEDF